MGRLKLDCLAINPNNTIVYGIGNAFFRGTEHFTKDNGVVVLVRTDPNPTSFSNIRWRIVSRAQASRFSLWEQALGTVDCAVNRAGVFSAMVTWTPSSPEEARSWAGIIYDPAKDGIGENGERSDGWSQFMAPKDYQWSGPIQSHAAMYLNQTHKVEGNPFVGVGVRERFVHAVLSAEGVLRFGSFGPLDPSRNNTIVSWNLANSSGNPIKPLNFVRFGQGYAHAYHESAGSIISYPLTDVAAPVPAGITTKVMGGISLYDIIPGVRDGVSFLACIGINAANNHRNLYFIYDYLNTTNTNTTTITPKYSIPYGVDYYYSLILELYQFVHSQYPSPTSPGTFNQFDFGITLNKGGIHVINFSGNSTSNTVGKTATSEFVIVDAPYDSYPIEPTRAPVSKGTAMAPRSMVGILACLGVALVLMVVGFRVWRRRVNQKTRALAAQPVGDRGEHLGPSIYQPPQYGHGQGQGIELTTPAVPYRQQHNPSARHNEADAPPPYAA